MLIFKKSNSSSSILTEYYFEARIAIILIHNKNSTDLSVFWLSIIVKHCEARIAIILIHNKNSTDLPVFWLSIIVKHCEARIAIILIYCRSEMLFRQIRNCWLDD